MDDFTVAMLGVDAVESRKVHISIDVFCSLQLLFFCFLDYVDRNPCSQLFILSKVQLHFGEKRGLVLALLDCLLGWNFWPTLRR